MNFKKITAALVAAATINSPVFSSGLILTDVLASDEQGSRVVATLPDWVPTDYESAIDFANTYGVSHVENGLICLLFPEIIEKVPPGQPQGMLQYEIRTTEGMMAKLNHNRFGSEEDNLCYEVVVYQPKKSGDFEAYLVDTWAEVRSDIPFTDDSITKYAFTVGEDLMDITETDIFGWLPDCCEEFDAFKKANGKVSVRDNYVLFCMDQNAGTAYSWQAKDTNDTEHLEHYRLQSCARKEAIPVEGGKISYIAVYKAAKDGLARIDWDFGSFALNHPEVTETLTADCIILDDAQTVMLSGDTRVKLINYDTLEPIEINTPSGFTLIDPVNSDDNSKVIADITSNPCIVRNLSVSPDEGIVLGLPAGYSIPKAEGTANNAEDYLSIRKYDNGAFDVVFKPRKEGENGLPPGATRVTFIDKDTGELIPEYLLEHHSLGFGVEMVVPGTSDVPSIQNPKDHISRTYTLETNPCIYKNDLAEKYSTAFEYQFWGEVQPEITTYDNGSMDLVFRTKIRVTGNVNSDYDFNIADAVSLQNWLLGKPDSELKNWAEADFTLDNQIDTFDLCIMLDKLVKREQNAPVALSVTETGGYAGVHYEWNVYKEDGKYFASYENKKIDDLGKIVTEITEKEFRDIMLVDYEGIIEAYNRSQKEMVIDGFYYKTILTYADGSEVNTKASMSYVIQLIEKIMQRYNVDTVKL
ncbi:MAG: dockerin type I repeat-containing protein [Ruminococcus sp.]|nr:dockerin type I repeat-containing protein [Ruminococcus sp.]